MRVRITQLDGKLPNLALMRISAFHKKRGDEVFFTFSPTKDPSELEYSLVYGSCIFKFNANRADTLKTHFPGAIVGGSGVEDYSVIQIGKTVKQILVEDVLNDPAEESDYSLYPNFNASIGFTQRGCRLKCGFCGVPGKEGENRSVASPYNVWRGGKFPRKLHLLDNDFFGQPKWRECVEEIRSGKFRVCLNQGINVRFITDESAEALASIEYRDDQFNRRRIYTAWDNPKQEKLFFDGIDRLNKAGIPSKHVMAYMLIGYWPDETWERIWFRFYKMVERGIMPYPMVFDRSRKDLCAFQRWVNMGLYRIINWNDFREPRKSFESEFEWAKVQAYRLEAR